MTFAEISRRQTAKPFEPYKMFLADGRTVEVPHPEVLAIEPEGRTLVIYVLPDRGQVIDLQLIVSLEYQVDAFLAEAPLGA